MQYGDKPKQLGKYNIECKEMMFYQYLPIKMPGNRPETAVIEDRLECFQKILGAICCDYVGEYGLNAYSASYIYLTAKCLYQTPKCPFNRPGWHCDGFMTDDVNYVWSDKNPTEFNFSGFNLTMHDSPSLFEMVCQAKVENNYTYDAGTLLRLNQYNVHRVAESQPEGVRVFLKVSFSKDKYDLIGNSHNYLLNYNWDMKERKQERNIPQSKI